MSISSGDIADFWFLVRKAASLIDREGESIFRDGLGITMAQFMVLSVVDAHPGTFNQQAVADLLGLTKGTVSRQIDAASRSGLLTAEVSETSRRENLVKLTAAGTALVRRGDAMVASANREHFDGLDTGDFAATLRTLARFTEAVGGEASPPSAHGYDH